MLWTMKEQKLLRLALDPSAQPGEAENAWLALLRSLRSRHVRGYDLEKDVTRLEADISAYFASLGRKSKGTVTAKERAKKAAAARWGKT